MLALDVLEHLKDIEVVLYTRLWSAFGEMNGYVVAEAEIPAVPMRIGRENWLGWHGLSGVVWINTKVQLRGFRVAFKRQMSSDSSGG
jgi:hypothetical protein